MFPRPCCIRSLPRFLLILLPILSPRALTGHSRYRFTSFRACDPECDSLANKYTSKFTRCCQALIRLFNKNLENETALQRSVLVKALLRCRLTTYTIAYYHRLQVLSLPFQNQLSVDRTLYFAKFQGSQQADSTRPQRKLPFSACG